ncbi:DUF2125 domain-containing protein [uncultured Paracoccus sp.]|uniref:DUF2125 domain-containing protein n=1 Tax=uncultured Paracoccus sp. TaxID=189685 RepID=UPI0026226C6F|nr:DUF2125 domain-containing protein [uncultured Paracoccus sp.]
MSFRTKSSLLALLATTAPAVADVTPVEVWQNWLSYYKANGYAVTEGAREEAGDTLTIRDAVFANTMHDGDVTITIPQVTLQATGDGQVRTTFSDSASGTFTGPYHDSDDDEADDDGSEADDTGADAETADRVAPETGDTVEAEAGADQTGDTAAADATAADQPGDAGQTVEVKFTAEMPGAEVLSSGSAGDITHDSRVPALTLKIDQVVSPEQTMDDLLTITVADLAYRQHVAEGDLTSMDFDMTAGRAEAILKAAGKDDDGEDFSADGTLSVASLTAAGRAALPADPNGDADMPAALRAGLDVQADIALGPLTLDFTATDAGEDGAPVPVSMDAEVEGISVKVGLSSGGLNYQLDSDGSRVRATSPEMQVPFSYATDSSGMVVQLPVSPADQPQPFKLAYSVAGLTVGDEIWAMFDPDGKLPRDPGNLDIDLTGMARVTADLLGDMDARHGAADEAATGAAADAAGAGQPSAADAANAQATADGADGAGSASTGTASDDAAPDSPDDDEDMPFEPVQITLNQFALDALGARITADGSMAAPEGGSLETPVGTINVRYEGVNGLIDTLTEMGFVKQEDVTGLRLMLAMFAKPAPEGGDVLTTELEGREDGTVFANGQQVK